MKRCSDGECIRDFCQVIVNIAFTSKEVKIHVQEYLKNKKQLEWSHDM